jgi:hypothetical protein
LKYWRVSSEYASRSFESRPARGIVPPNMFEIALHPPLEGGVGTDGND